MVIATTSLQPLLMSTSDIMQNTWMCEKLQIREFLQDYKIVINRTARRKDFKILDFIVLKMHHSIVASLSE